MPLFACYRGDAAGIPQQEDNCFCVVDDNGRTWFCREASEQIDPTEIFRLGYLARKNGFSEGGSLWRGNADDEDELKQQLTAVE